MSYQDIANMAENWDLRMRMVACAAQEQPGDPITFVGDNVFRLCAQPGWDAAWASAAAAGVDSPGADPSVITDEAILSGVQSVLGVVTEQAQQQAQQQAQVEAQAKAAEVEHAAALAAATVQATTDATATPTTATGKATS